MAEGSDNDQDKDLPASERKIENARKEGNLPRSKELSSGLTLIVSVVFLYNTGPAMANSIRELFIESLTFSKREGFDQSIMSAKVVDLLIDSLFILTPLFLVIVIAAIAGGVAVGGLNWSTKPLEPKLSKLNPISGLKNIFSSNGLAEFIKAILKSILIGAVGFYIIYADLRSYASLSSMHFEHGLSKGVDIVSLNVLLVSLLFLLIIAIDVPFQLYKYFKGLRMNLEEVKKEHKESEGDPHLKAKIKSMQKERARKRMMASVGSASVIVTNPTHYSVALKYDQSSDSVPIVVAKGRGELALKIRELAQQNGVPRVEAPPLARALYTHVELEQSVPPELFQAVAKLLAYIYAVAENSNKEKLHVPGLDDIPHGMDPGPDKE